MSVHPEVATVFRGGGRRWFTRAAAERAEARTILKRRCECESGDGNRYPGFTCDLHRDPVRYQRIVRLMVAMFVRRTPTITAGESDA
jgi:hypothetical protein